MNTCDHDHLHAVAQPYVLNDADGGVLARTVHVQVSCALCGAPFRFEGAYAPPPVDVDAMAVMDGPWATVLQDQIATRIRPFTPEETPFVAAPAGRA